MPNNINRIGINTNGVNPYSGQAKGNETKPEESKTEDKKTVVQNTQVKPDEVFNYLAQQAVAFKPQVSATKTYDINKYVTAEQAERIAGFITSFEDKVAKGLAALDAEFGNTLSDQAKYEIAANMA